MTQRVGQVAATGPAGREIEHEPLFFIYRGSVQLRPHVSVALPSM